MQGHCTHTHTQKAGNHREAYYSEKFRNLPPDADREQGKDYRYKV